MTQPIPSPDEQRGGHGLAWIEPRVRLGHALRAVLAEGYGRSGLAADAMAGVVVAIIALPLSMALAIATGVPPQHGIYTAIVGGAVVGLLGGSRFQVTGPTAAFVVVLAPIAHHHGLNGLLVAGFLAGLLLIGMGLARLGRLIEFIPYTVTVGFTVGIATVIGALQLRDALGLRVAQLPDAFPEKLAAFWRARATTNPVELCVAAATLAVLVFLPKLTRRVPAALVAIVLASLLSAWLEQLAPSFHVTTVGDRFVTRVGDEMVRGIPRLPPLPRTPWGDTPLSLALLREMLPAAMTIALLGAIESLLSAVIADGLTGTRHDPNTELVALGIGNCVAPCFGGIAATGALARTAANIRSGARSPLSAVFHAIVVLVVVLVGAPLVSRIPMAALAALLMVVAWNMAELRLVRRILRVAPKSDVAVLASCFTLTVVFDMVVAVMAGVVFAALLFMRRMAELTQARVLTSSASSTRERTLPPHVALYEIAGPLFFGAASRGMAALDELGNDVRVVVFDLGRVPVIDTSGFLALESALERLEARRIFVILAGPLPEPRSVFARAKLEGQFRLVMQADNIESALAMARDVALLSPEWDPTPALASSATPRDAKTESSDDRTS